MLRVARNNTAILILPEARWPLAGRCERSRVSGSSCMPSVSGGVGCMTVCARGHRTSRYVPAGTWRWARSVWSSAFRRVQESSGAAGSSPSDPRMRRRGGLFQPARRPNSESAKGGPELRRYRPQLRSCTRWGGLHSLRPFPTSATLDAVLLCGRGGGGASPTLPLLPLASDAVGDAGQERELSDSA